LTIEANGYPSQNIAGLSATYGPTGLANNGSPAELPLSYGSIYDFINNPNLSGSLPSYVANTLAAFNTDAYSIRSSGLEADTFARCGIWIIISRRSAASISSPAKPHT